MAKAEVSFWNLCQASVWVDFREINLVNEFARPDRQAYRALHWYPKMWPEGRQKIGQPNDLYDALLDGRLKASGQRNDTDGTRSAIPKENWIDMYLDPPDALDRRPAHREGQPWQRVLVKSADVQRLWLAPDVVKSRELFNWADIQTIYEEVKSENPEFSQRRTVGTIQSFYERRVGGKSPSRSAIQAKMKLWQ